jgi:hypothetical protein
LAKPVLYHGRVFVAEGQLSGVSIDQVITELFRTVPPPARRG